jgi:hypothetical protein
VPNLPSPLFATLRRLDLEPDGGAPAPTRRFAPVPGQSSRRVKVQVEKAAPKSERMDEDGVLEPSIR